MQNAKIKIEKTPQNMKTKTDETGKQKTSGLINKMMNRKEALQKSGYIAAAMMMIMMSTGKAGSSVPATAPTAPTRRNS
jgi:hypothetical protein